MIDFDSTNTELSSLNSKLTEIGDSLWHFQFRKGIKRIRKRNY